MKANLFFITVLCMVFASCQSISFLPLNLANEELLSDEVMATNDEFCQDRTDSYVVELEGFSKYARFTLTSDLRTALIYEDDKYQLVDVKTGKPKTPRYISIGQQNKINDAIYAVEADNFIIIGNQSGRGYFFAKLLDPTGSKGVHMYSNTYGAFESTADIITLYDETRALVAGTISDGTHWIAYLNFNFGYTKSLFELTQIKPISILTDSKDHGTLLVGRLGSGRRSRLFISSYLHGRIRDVGAQTFHVGSYYGHAMMEGKDEWNGNANGFRAWHVVSTENEIILHRGQRVSWTKNGMSKKSFEAQPVPGVKPNIYTVKNETHKFFVSAGNRMWIMNTALKAVCSKELTNSSTLKGDFQNIQVFPLGGTKDDYLGSAIQGDKFYIRRIVVKPPSLVIFGDPS